MSKQKDVAGMIETLLKGGEPVEVLRFRELAEQMGVSVRTLTRAKESLGKVRSKRVEGLAGDGYWVWQWEENDERS